MGYWKKDNMSEKEDEGSKFVPKETLKDIEKYPFVDIPDRGIRKETCERFGVKGYVNNGKLEAIYFPYYDQKGVLTAYKKQDVTKHKSEKGHWGVIGSLTISNKLFGQDVAEKINRKKNNVFVTEGCHDAMAAFQAMKDQVKGSKFDGMEPFVVSISMGTANAVEALLHNEGFIQSHEKITLAFDGDSTTPAEKLKGIMKGLEATEAVAGAFVGDNLYVVPYENGYKDCSDYLQAGKSNELAKLLQFGTKRFVTEKISYASDVTFEDLIKKREEGLYCPSFPKLMSKIRGFRKSELILLTSGVGVGKSTVTASFAADFISAGERVGLIFLEETQKETLQRMVAHHLKVNFNNFKNDPLSCASEESIREAYDFIVNDDKAVFLSHFGHMSIEELMPKIKHMHLVSKCDRIIIDHLTLVTASGSSDIDERKEIDKCMTMLAAFCASNPVTIIAISHINRGNFADNKPPKDAETEAYWVKVDKSHMRGSSALEALSWIILGLEGQVMPDRSRGNARLTVLKNRPFGNLGVCDEFCLDPNTWEVLLVD